MPTDVTAYWTAVAALATIASMVILLVTAIVFLCQLIALKRSTYAQSFFGAVQLLQNDEQRRLRKHVFDLKDIPLDKWAPDDIAAAEKVCQAYDCVGIMARNKLLPQKIIVDSWGDSLRRLWPIVEPLVIRYRKRGDPPSPEYWDDVEWLYIEAQKLADRRWRKFKSA